MGTFAMVISGIVLLPMLVAKAVLALSPEKIEVILMKHHDEYGEFNYKAAAREIWFKNWL